MYEWIVGLYLTIFRSILHRCGFFFPYLQPPTRAFQINSSGYRNFRDGCARTSKWASVNLDNLESYCFLPTGSCRVHKNWKHELVFGLDHKLKPRHLPSPDLDLKVYDWAKRLKWLPRKNNRLLGRYISYKYNTFPMFSDFDLNRPRPNGGTQVHHRLYSSIVLISLKAVLIDLANSIAQLGEIINSGVETT